jgi:hypothetical protein
MSTTIEQPTFTLNDRVVTTRHGFRLRVPINVVHEGTMVVRGAMLRTLWKRAEALVQDGHSVRLDAPEGMRTRLSFRFYGRSIVKSQLGALARLKQFHERHGDFTWAHLKDFGGPRHGDWARLRHWLLIEPKMVDGEHDRGWWRLTGLGHLWLRGSVKVPRRAAVFDGRMVGWIDVRDVISVGEVDPEFSLDRVMGAA